MDLPIVRWASRTLFYRMQQRFDQVIRNFPNRWLALLMRILVFPLGRHMQQPTDKLGHQVASLMITPNEARTRLTEGAYKAAVDNNPVGQMEASLLKIIAAEELEKKIHKAIKQKKLLAYTYEEQIADAVLQGIITPNEEKQLLEVVEARAAVIAVDHFAAEELIRT